MEYEIREAEKRDVAAIVEFNLMLALETEGRKLDPETLTRGVETVVDAPQLGRYFVAVQDEQPVGQIMLTYEWSDWRNGLILWLQSVYVAPEHRRHGVFRRLYEHVVSEARQERGVIGLRLYVESANARARETYRNLGMKPAGYDVFERFLYQV